MSKGLWSQWKWGIFAALAITFLMLLPQMSFWVQTGNGWQGSYMLLHTDEVAYSAYINALIDGRERRNDPYTGRDNRDDAPQTESLFSIQFVPAYLIAVPARLLGLSASSAFIWLTAFSSFLSALSIFWLIRSITGDIRLAAAGTIFVLCFGALAASYGEIRVYLGDYLGQGAGLVAIPFTRRYQPAATFPLLFVFFGLFWHALVAEQRRTIVFCSIVAGLSFTILVFSYFYLWTAAAAWLACLAFLYFVFRWQGWKRNLVLFLTVGVFAVATIIPYLFLLAQRAKSLDETQALTITHLPDLFRACEILGILLAVIIGYGVWRGVINLKEHLTLFGLSFALLPLVVFNQQIITGISLQPIHYELYIVNYIVLVAWVITISLLAQKRLSENIPNRILIWVTILSLCWGFIEITGLMKRNASLNKVREESMLVANRLKVLADSDKINSAINNVRNSAPTVLAATIDQADLLPTVSPQAVLWAPHSSVFSGLASGENKERFYQYLYFSGADEKELATAISKNQFEVVAAIFGYERALPALTTNSKPITLGEIRAEMRRYAEFKLKFTREKAARHNLSYVVTFAKDEPSFSNLDRWFERDKGEQIGIWKLYRIKLRP